MENSKLRDRKKQIRKEVREELRQVGSPDGLIAALTLNSNENFNLKASQLWYLDKMKTALTNQTRSAIVEKVIRPSSLYTKIKAMRRDQNEDKKETAKVIKKAIAEQGFTEEDITNQRDQLLMLDKSFHALDIAKTELSKDIEAYLLKQPIYVNWLKQVRGMGILLSAKLLRLVGDITRFNKVSSLWHYFGLHVIKKCKECKKTYVSGLSKCPKCGSMEYEEIAPKLTSGEQCTWVPKGRALAYLIAEEQKKVPGAQFREYYDVYKERDSRKHPDYRKFYLETRAFRYCAKMFLLEFWIASYKAKGLEPPTKPYSTRYHPNEDFKLKVPYTS